MVMIALAFIMFLSILWGIVITVALVISNDLNKSYIKSLESVADKFKVRVEELEDQITSQFKTCTMRKVYTIYNAMYTIEELHTINKALFVYVKSHNSIHDINRTMVLVDKVLQHIWKYSDLQINTDMCVHKYNIIGFTKPIYRVALTESLRIFTDPLKGLLKYVFSKTRHKM